MVALCKSSYVQGTQLLKQTCWLSFGAILNELQRMAQKARATRTHLIPEIIMPPRKMDFYKRVGFYFVSNYCFPRFLKRCLWINSKSQKTIFTKRLPLSRQLVLIIEVILDCSQSTNSNRKLWNEGDRHGAERYRTRPK